MSTAIVGALIQNPSVFVTKFIGEPLISVAIVYGIVWLLMRPKDGRNLPFFWHLAGLTATLLGAAVIRIFAIATFAGRSAYEFEKNSDASLYYLIIPAAVAAGFIAWLKRKTLQNKAAT